jgi:prophage tail gpP-like protein
MALEIPADSERRKTALDIAETLIKRDPSFKEIATLAVRGRLYTDWKSVRVEQRVSQAFSTFMFECSEETPIPLKRVALQFIPGDPVKIYLGGQLALTGFIEERHVAYDALQHSVRLMGVSDTRDLVTSTVPKDNLDGHDGQNWAQLTQDIMSHLGIKLRTVGGLNYKPFQKIGLQPGERIIDVIERHAKMRDIVIGSYYAGGLLGIGPQDNIPSGELVENYNILRANAVMRDAGLMKRMDIMGQNTGGSSGGGGAAANEMVATRFGTATRNKHMVLTAEIADDTLEPRADMEVVFTEGTEIEANIVVQGWFKDNNKSDQIWRANESYIVNSTSLILNGDILGCSACVYEQSDAGTTTTLTMVDPIHLNKGVNIDLLLAQRREGRTLEQIARQQLESGAGGIGRR